MVMCTRRNPGRTSRAREAFGYLRSSAWSGWTLEESLSRIIRLFKLHVQAIAALHHSRIIGPSKARAQRILTCNNAFVDTPCTVIVNGVGS